MIRTQSASLSRNEFIQFDLPNYRKLTMRLQTENVGQPLYCQFVVHSVYHHHQTQQYVHYLVLFQVYFKGIWQYIFILAYRQEPLK